MNRRRVALASCLCNAFVLLAHAGDPALQDGERIVLVGNTLIERAAEHGYIETRLAALFPGQSIIVRNLGWSGDTVFADSRAGFDTAAEGFTRLSEWVQQLAPTWILVGYGGNEAYAGEPGLRHFLQGLERLLDMLSETGADIALLAPIRHEDLGRPLPDPTAHNRHLRLYAESMRDVASRRGHRWIELEPRLGVQARGQPSTPLTDNGMHLNALGYWRAGESIQEALGCSPFAWRAALTAEGEIVDSVGTELSEVSAGGAGLEFVALDATLPEPPLPEMENAVVARPVDNRILQIDGLSPGQYELAIDDQHIVTADAEAWGAGVAITSGPEFDAVEALRAAIVHKNRLFFYRWRPQNTTYLFGFRSHEQGQNAEEVARLDPLIAAAQEEVTRLSAPRPHTYHLRPVDAADR